jgi:hypothetical protein
MRFLKAQNTNLRSLYAQGVKYDINGQVIMDSSDMLLVPKGSEADKTTSAENGHIRYNTDKDDDGVLDIGFEAFNNGSWERLRFREPSPIGITWQNIGTGDADEKLFGLLDSGDPDYPIPDASTSVLVLVENVIQIPEVNYFLEQSDGTNVAGHPGPNPPYAAGWYIVFTEAVPFGKEVVVVHNLDK